MIRRMGLLLVLVLTATVVVPTLPRAAAAQSGTELLTQALRAYQNLDYDVAAGLLRRSLDAPGPLALADTSRLRALSYLGATEVFRGRRDSAAAVFRRLVLLDPRYRPDQLIFPPDVTNAYDAIRRITKTVAVALPADTTVELGDELYPVRLFASSFHDVAVSVTSEDGRLLRQLYSGPIGDSILARWDGLDSAGTAPAVGRFRLRVISRDAAGRPLRQFQAAVETRLAPPDTVPLPPPPPDSAFRPERGPAGGGPRLGSLGAGLGAGAVVVLLPSVMASGSNASSGRFVVAGALSLTGLYAFLANRGGQPIEANVIANRAVRNAWERQRDEAIRENAARRRTRRLRLIAGPVVPTDTEGP